MPLSLSPSTPKPAEPRRTHVTFHSIWAGRGRGPGAWDMHTSTRPAPEDKPLPRPSADSLPIAEPLQPDQWGEGESEGEGTGQEFAVVYTKVAS